MKSEEEIRKLLKLREKDANTFLELDLFDLYESTIKIIDDIKYILDELE